jgi:cation transport ATPase
MEIPEKICSDAYKLSSPAGVPVASVARRTLGIIKENIIFALGVKALFII